MKLIFWGLLITCLHFNLNFGDSTIDLIPSFLGWYLVLKGVSELPPCTARDHAAGPIKVTIALSVLTWSLQILGGMGILGSTISLLAACIPLYTLYLLIKLVAAVETIVSHAMPIANMRECWMVLTICTLGRSLLGLFASRIDLIAIIVLVLALIGFIAMICLLVQFWKAHKAYEEAMAHPIEILPPEE